MPVLPVSSLFQPSAGAVPVLDPELKAYGRLWLPKAWAEPTVGLERCLQGKGQGPVKVGPGAGQQPAAPGAGDAAHPPSLCLLYQAQRSAGILCGDGFVL